MAAASPPTAGAQVSRRDSLRLLDQARSAQSAFEASRNMNLPRMQPEDQRACDAVIGRMCYWDEDSDEQGGRDSAATWEPVATNRARRKLVATLDRLGGRLPGDSWIVGQQVRYLVEGGADSAAIAAGHECRSVQWWCGVLTGYALHASGDYADAESAFDSALAQMPRDVRCRWTDISLLLDDAERENYQRLPCEARDSVERRFWALARPSYAVKGNDRRTEHFSRVLLAELWATSRNAYGMSWADDMREVLIRFGAPQWYATTWPTGFGNAAGVVGHDRRHGYHFAADIDHGAVSWNPRARPAREKYAAPYLDSLATIDAQFAMLKRGDSAVLVAAYSGANLSNATVLGVSSDSGVTMVSGDSAQPRIRSAHTEWKDVVAGIEAYDRVNRIDRRVRWLIVPPVAAPGAPELSTILFFAGDTPGDVSTIDEALAHALTTSVLKGARKLGLYWEMYARDTASSQAVDSGATQAGDGVELPAGDTLSRSDSSADVAISVTRIDSGVLKWLAQALHLSPQDSRVAMRWHETRVGDVTARSVVLDLAELPAGTYRITLSVGPDDRHRTTTAREITLR